MLLFTYAKKDSKILHCRTMGKIFRFKLKELKIWINGNNNANAEYFLYLFNYLLFRSKFLQMSTS